MTRSTMPLAQRWQTVRETRRCCLSDWIADVLYLAFRLL